MSQATIIEQNNARLVALVEQFDAARETWATAAEQWEAAHAAPAGVNGGNALEAAAYLDEAEKQAREAAANLAAHIASWVRTGYRLHLPDEK